MSLRRKDDVQHNAVIVGVRVVSVAVPAGRFYVNLYIAGKRLARFVEQHGVAKVRPRKRAAAAGIHHLQPMPVFGDKPVGERVRPAPQRNERAFGVCGGGLFGDC